MKGEVFTEKVEFGEGEGKVTIDDIAKRVEAYKSKKKIEAITDALKYFEVI